MAPPVSDNDLSTLLRRWVALTDTPVSIAGADDSHVVVYVNPAFESTSGYPATDLLDRGETFLRAAEVEQGAAEAVAEAIRTGRPTRTRVLNYRADGSTWWSELHLCAIPDESGRPSHVVGLQLDITEQVRNERQIVHAATHDDLTDLVTRSHFLDQFDREVARAAREGSGLAVLFLDVDDLKDTNDAFGHAAGDALLVEVARRLTSRLRGSDLAARYGGDEFLVLLVELPHDPADAAAGAAKVADELRDLLSEPIAFGDVLLPVKVSIGLSLFPRDASTALELVDHADAAMYRQKSQR